MTKVFVERERATAPATASEQGERIHALDAVRAGAMLAGIAVHAAVSFMATDQVPWPVRDTHRQIGFDLFAGWMHSFRMPLFFVVAGLFARLVLERRGVRGFIAHRAQRVLAPFLLGLVTVLPAIAAVTVYAQVHPGGTSPSLLALAVWHHFTSDAFLTGLDTAHLWFLYYLIFLYAAVLLITQVARRLVRTAEPRGSRLDAIGHRLVRAWWKPLLLAVPTAALLALMDSPSFDSPVSFVPHARLLAAYGLFFGFGWLLHRHNDLLPLLARGAWTQCLLAIFVVFPAYVAMVGLRARSASLGPTLACAAAHALSTWLLVLGVIGLALRYLARPRAPVRYLADSAYWLYLIHPPLVIWLQIQLAPLALPAMVKLLVILSVSVPLMLLSYRYLVRPTALGLLLNGRRYPNRVPALRLPAPSVPASDSRRGRTGSARPSASREVRNPSTGS